jgi:3-hydroxyacyl-CoA dehydrogenase
LKVLVAGQDKAGEFYRHFHYGLFSYISYRIPEISDEIFRVDDAMMAGFGWEIGAFESWDVLGVEKTVKAMKEAGYSVAPWVDEMLASGNKSFYKIEKRKQAGLFSTNQNLFFPHKERSAGSFYRNEQLPGQAGMEERKLPVIRFG